MIINVALDNVKKVSNKSDDFSRIQALFSLFSKIFQSSSLQDMWSRF